MYIYIYIHTYSDSDNGGLNAREPECVVLSRVLNDCTNVLYSMCM